jgi:GNAT superfamily N-acetyltransferase
MSDINKLNDLTRQLGYPLTIEETQKNLRVMLANTNEQVLVAVENDSIVGWMHVFHTVRLESGSFSELGGLVVDRDHRGKGIGKMLVKEAIAWSKERGIPTLRLRSNTIRKTAHEFYRNLGFKEIKEQKVFDLQLF